MGKKNSTLIWKWTPLAEELCGFKRADQVLTWALNQKKGNWQPHPPTPSTFTRSQIQKWIQEKKIFLKTHAALLPKTHLLAHQEILLYHAISDPLSICSEQATHLPALSILYEDKEFLVLNKPPHLITHPTPSSKKLSIVHLLLHHKISLSSPQDPLRPGIVHRLDQGTSGTLLIAKTNQAHRYFLKLFKERTIHKTYLALCFRSPTKKTWTISSSIGRNPKLPHKMTCQKHQKKSRSAFTEVFLLKVFSQDSTVQPFASFLKISIKTGRTHQIRVHLTSENLSLLGDPVYGTPRKHQRKWNVLPKEIKTFLLSHPRPMLHAKSLTFPHPQTKKTLTIEAPFPSDFQTLLKMLEKNHVQNHLAL